MFPFKALVRENSDSVGQGQVFELDVFSTEHRLKTTPKTNSILPANNWAVDVRIAFKNSALENSGIDNLAAWSDYDTGTDHNVRSDLGALGDHSSWMDHDAITVFQAQFLHSFDVKSLANKVILGLADVHPEAVEFEWIKLIFERHQREDFSLDRAGLVRDPVDHTLVEKVKASVDSISNEGWRFFHESFDFARGFVGDDNAVLAWVWNFSRANCALLAMLCVELNHSSEREVADDIWIEHEELAQSRVIMVS